MLKTALLIIALTLAAASRADAQIYAWTDANGTMVLSDRPRPGGGEVKTFAVAGTPKVRTTAAPLEPAKASRSARFDELIREHATSQGVSPDLVRAVIQQESGFNPFALSPKGAQGLMQLMPATARELGVTDPFEPTQNIRGGVRYLRRLLDLYRQDVPLALAAYNAGPGAVSRYGAVPPYRETQDYVRRITRSAGPVPLAAVAKVEAKLVIYKWLDDTQGQPVVRYSDRPPAGVAFEIVGRR